MKKILPVLFAFLILLTLPVQAAGGKLTAAAAKSGDQVTVTLRLDNPGIVATLIRVKYESGVLQLTGVKNGDVFSSANATFGNDYANNPYTVLWMDATRTDNNTTSGTLCTLTFTVKGGTESGKTTVRFSVDKTNTFDVNMKEVAVADCTCSVDVPTVTTKATQAATPTTAKPTASQTPTTTKPTTTKPTTTKPTTTKPTTTKPTTTKTPAVTTTKPIVTFPKPTAPKSTAASGMATSAASTSTTAAQGTASAKETAADQTASETKPAQGETALFSDVMADGTLSTVSATQAESMTGQKKPFNPMNLLYLILLIPVIAVVILIATKKKK